MDRGDARADRSGGTQFSANSTRMAGHKYFTKSINPRSIEEEGKDICSWLALDSQGQRIILQSSC